MYAQLNYVKVRAVIIKRQLKREKMSTQQQTQQKQKYLRENIDPEHYEDFAEFFANEVSSDDLDIGRFNLQELKNIVNKFNVSRAKEENQQQHQRSFANYQTAGLQQAFNVVAAMQSNSGNSHSSPHSFQKDTAHTQSNQLHVPSHQNLSHSITSSPQQKNQVSSPQKPNYPSASDLLDSVMSESQKNSSQNNSPQTSNQNTQLKHRSNIQAELFEKGNIWATTSNVQNQRKSPQFDAFWQFSSNVNTMANMNKKQEFKTENPFTKQAFDFAPSNNKTAQKPGELIKPPEMLPNFQQLTKNLNMSKKPNLIGSGNVEVPSNMKKQEVPSLSYSSTLPRLSSEILGNNIKNTKLPSGKQIKLIAQKPLNQSSLSAVSNQQPASVIRPPTSTLSSAYKGQKIPYKGQAVHRSQFKDIIKCYEASVRPQLNDKRLEINIEKHQIIEKNFFVGDYVMYYMNVKPLNIVCKRNYEDFTKLKSALQKFYPGMQLPWLEKNSWFETSAENIKKQKVMMEFFIHDLIKNPEVRNSRIFEDFLTLKQHKAIKRKFEEYSKMDQYKAIEQMCITGGKIEVIVDEPQRIYHEHLAHLIEQFEEMLGRKNKLIETLGAQFVQVNQTLTSLSKLSTQMSEQVKKFNQSVTDDEIPSLQSTFNVISKSYEEWANRISFESKVVNKRLVPFYRYQKDNLETMKCLLATENQFHKSYMKRSVNEASTSTESYSSSGLKGFKTGILQESKNFTVLKYQLGYLSNMVCKENVRFFELMSDNFKAKWIYQAEKYNQRLSKDMQFYTSISAMAR